MKWKLFNKEDQQEDTYEEGLLRLSKRFSDAYYVSILSPFLEERGLNVLDQASLESWVNNVQRALKNFMLKNDQICEFEKTIDVLKVKAHSLLEDFLCIAKQQEKLDLKNPFN